MQSQLEFVVGTEKRIAEIVSRTEMEPLLRSIVKAGPRYVAVLDEDGLPLCRQGDIEPTQTTCAIRHQLLVEGEPKGTLVVVCDDKSSDQSTSLALLARDALQLIVNNNLKRMLTTELHTSVVQESYQQLLESNQRLAESEKCYRELALSLEQKVNERTAELQKAYTRMLQQEKLAAVGSLAAGMAHEINNPNGFIRSNLSTYSRYFNKMNEMIHHYQLLVADNTPLIRLQQEAERKRRDLKLDFIISDTSELLKQSLDGTDRIAAIVANLKSFTHLDETGIVAVDLNDEMNRTLAVIKPHIAADTVIECTQKPLPFFRCNPGLMTQAFFNIIQNALQSRPEKLVIKISSSYGKSGIEIVIEDNGNGIPSENLSRIFEPFFTTHEVGCGTGMGLTVARDIIVNSGGAIEIMSSEQSGTTVIVRLPIMKENR